MHCLGFVVGSVFVDCRVVSGGVVCLSCVVFGWRLVVACCLLLGGRWLLPVAHGALSVVVCSLLVGELFVVVLVFVVVCCLFRLFSSLFPF